LLDEKMTIAVIAADYPPMLGGIARFTGDLVLFLARTWTVKVYCRTDTEPVAWATFPHTGCFRGRELYDAPEAAAQRLVQVGVTCVLINHIDLVGPRTLRAFRTAGLRSAVLFYGADINLKRSLRSHLRMYVTAALAHHRIVISKGTRAIFHRRLPGLSTRMVLPGIDVHANEIPPAEPGEGVIAIGRLVRRKGFDTLLDAAVLLRQQGLLPRFTLIGDGEDRDWLSRRVTELGLNATVRLRSGLTDDEIRAELRTHRVFCLLPRSMGNGDVEGFGIVFLEAAREGRPVVAGRSGGVPDAVADQRNGFLVDPNQPAEAAERLRQLLTDDDLWKRQSRESIVWCNTFAWSNRDPAREFSFFT
jgi:phosphatidylinositol alpha-1,6-mannosyltransferase